MGRENPPFLVKLAMMKWDKGLSGKRKRPVWIFMPMVREGPWEEETPEAIRAAKEAGFVIIDLSDVFEGQDPAALRLAEWDQHPNARAHRLLAERLYRELEARGDAVFGSAERGRPADQLEPARRK